MTGNVGASGPAGASGGGGGPLELRSIEPPSLSNHGGGLDMAQDNNHTPGTLEAHLESRNHANQTNAIPGAHTSGHASNLPHTNGGAMATTYGASGMTNGALATHPHQTALAGGAGNAQAHLPLKCEQALRNNAPATVAACAPKGSTCERMATDAAAMISKANALAQSEHLAPNNAHRRVPATLAETIAIAQARANPPRGAKRVAAAAAAAAAQAAAEASARAATAAPQAHANNGKSVAHAQAIAAQAAAAANAKPIAAGKGGKSVEVVHDKVKTPYWQIMDEYFRDITQEDVRIAFLGKYAPNWSPATDPAFTIPPLGRRYVSSLADAAFNAESYSAPTQPRDTSPPAIAACAPHELAALAVVVAQLDTAAEVQQGSGPPPPEDGNTLAARAISARSAAASTTPRAAVPEQTVLTWLTAAGGGAATTPADAPVVNAVHEWLRSHSDIDVDRMPVPQPDPEALHPYTRRLLRIPLVERTREDVAGSHASAELEDAADGDGAAATTAATAATKSKADVATRSATRCEVCQTQRRGRCDTELAPPGCLRLQRQGASGAAIPTDDAAAANGVDHSAGAHRLLVECVEQECAEKVPNQAAALTSLRQKLLPHEIEEVGGSSCVAMDATKQVPIHALMADAPEDEVLEELCAVQAELLAVHRRNQVRMLAMLDGATSHASEQFAAAEQRRAEQREVRQFMDEQRELRRLQKRERKRREEAKALAAATAAVEASSRGPSFRATSAAAGASTKVEPAAGAPPADVKEEALPSKLEPGDATTNAEEAPNALKLVGPHAPHPSQDKDAQAGRANLPAGAATPSNAAAGAAGSDSQLMLTNGDVDAAALIASAAAASPGSLSAKELGFLVSCAKDWKRSRDALRSLLHLVQQCEHREATKREVARVEQELDDVVAEHPHLYASLSAGPNLGGDGAGLAGGGGGTGKRKGGKRAGVGADDSDGVVARAVVMTSDAARRTNSQLPPGFRYVPMP